PRPHHGNRLCYLRYHATVVLAVVLDRIFEPMFNKLLDSIAAEVEEPQRPADIITREILMHSQRCVSLIETNMLFDVLYRAAKLCQMLSRQSLLHPLYQFGGDGGHSERLVNVSHPSDATFKRFRPSNHLLSVDRGQRVVHSRQRDVLDTGEQG